MLVYERKSAKLIRVVAKGERFLGTPLCINTFSGLVTASSFDRSSTRETRLLRETSRSIMTYYVSHFKHPQVANFPCDWRRMLLILFTHSLRFINVNKKRTFLWQDGRAVKAEDSRFILCLYIRPHSSGATRVGSNPTLVNLFLMAIEDKNFFCI